MDKTNIEAFKREGNNGRQISLGRDKKGFSKYLTKNFVLLNVLAILLGRASILNSLIPFGIAFFALMIVKEKRNWVYGFSVVLGIASSNADKIKYIITILMIFVVFRYLIKGIKVEVFRLAIYSSIINFVAGLIYIAFTGFYLYDLFMNGFESIVIFVFIYILSYALPPLLLRTNRKVLSNEELICIAIVAAVSILGISNYSIYGLSVKNIVGLLLTLIFAYYGGASIGASVGVTIGIITSMSKIGTPYIISIYAFSGLLAGIFRDMGKIPSGLGMILGNSILTFYINGSTEVIIQFEEVLTACIVFILTPKVFMEYAASFIDTRVNYLRMDEVYSDRIKKITLRQLREYSKALSELAITYSQIAEKEKIVEQKEITAIINKIANSICLNCSMRRNCWENSFYSTYNSLIDSIAILETQGELKNSNAPLYLKKRCLKIDELLKVINSKFDIYKVDYKWNKKLFEMRQLVSEQFKGISQVIFNLSKEIESNIEFKKEVEDALYVAFDKEGIAVNSITVLENDRGSFEIEIEKKNCYNGKICENNIIPLVSKTIGKDLVKKNKDCNLKNNKNTCVIKLIEPQRFRTNTGVARIAKGEKSGDSYSFLDLKENKHMIALSDGMGTGEKAAKDSMATISLLEQLMEAGFNKDITIKTINSILMSKSLDEAFSTIDLSIIDLYTGRAEFIKIGAAASFIKKSNGEIKIIETSSLPAGIINEIIFDSKTLKLDDGDFIITVSDGVLDVDKNLIDKNNWIVNVLKDLNTRNPQTLADKILDKALERCNYKVEDDMTIIVTKMWKK